MRTLLGWTTVGALLAGCVAAAGEATPAIQPTRLSPLKTYTPVKPPNCACEIFSKSDPKAAVFVSGMKGEDARMNVDGQDVVLVLQRQVLLSELDPKAGPGFERTYAYGKTSIRAAFKPGPYQGGEEVGEGAREGSPMDVTFSISRGQQTEVLKASGMCGC